MACNVLPLTAKGNCGANHPSVSREVGVSGGKNLLIFKHMKKHAIGSGARPHRQPTCPR